jgi:D-glycero-alpha-D-manno-heptose-7-phosphate kinase
MIATRAPLRISFAGGGTDFPDFYLNHNEGGNVVSATIDKYVYVLLNPRFDDKIRASYSKTEIVDELDDLQHEIVRECLKIANVTQGIEVITLADVPSKGAGLGSSSSLTVALLRALSVFVGTELRLSDLAELACKVEIDILGKPMGKQDQYAAALGGVNHIRFDNDGTVHHRLIDGVSFYNKLSDHLMLFFTGIICDETDILTEQKANIADRHWLLSRMSNEAVRLMAELPHNQDAIGTALKTGWYSKRQLASGISNLELDTLVQRACAAGAIGCKVAGAGGGGFLLVYCLPSERVRIRQELSELQELHFKIVPTGSEVLVSG